MIIIFVSSKLQIAESVVLIVEQKHKQNVSMHVPKEQSMSYMMYPVKST